jgi:hypothetical protein
MRNLPKIAVLVCLFSLIGSQFRSIHSAPLRSGDGYDCVLLDHEDPVYSFSSGGPHLLIDLRTGQQTKVNTWREVSTNLLTVRSPDKQLAARWDEETGSLYIEIGTNPNPVLLQKTKFAWTEPHWWSPDQTKLAYMTSENAPGTTKLWILNVKTWIRQSISVREIFIRHGWSPDSNYFAYTEQNAPDSDQDITYIWSVKDNRVIQTLSREHWFDNSFWLPDGRWAYVWSQPVNRNANADVLIYLEVKPISDISKTPVSASEVPDSSPHDHQLSGPSPDGHHYAYNDAQVELFIFDSNGTPFYRFRIVGKAAWIDSHKLITIRYLEKESEHELAIFDVDTGNFTPLSRELTSVIVGDAAYDGAYATHGNRIAMVTQDRNTDERMFVLKDSDGNTLVTYPINIWQVDDIHWVGNFAVVKGETALGAKVLIWSRADGSGFHQIGDSSNSTVGYARFNPDQNHFVLSFVFEGDFESPVLINLETGETQRLLKMAVEDVTDAVIRWSPDNTRVAFQYGPDLYIFDTQGRQIMQVQNVFYQLHNDAPVTYDNIVWLRCDDGGISPRF